jgi:hypothetical protein
MYARQYAVPERSFSLFGPRGTGKTTWLRQVLPDALWFDLLRTRTFLELTRQPDSFRQQAGQPVLHEAVRLLRRPAMPRLQHQGRCQGSVHGLAHGQGVGEAVHAGAAPRHEVAHESGGCHTFPSTVNAISKKRRNRPQDLSLPAREWGPPPSLSMPTIFFKKFPRCAMLCGRCNDSHDMIGNPFITIKRFLPMTGLRFICRMVLPQIVEVYRRTIFFHGIKSLPNTTKMF